jgi:5-methylthioadenosine/S-adenosylhomocysteine deaminase
MLTQTAEAALEHDIGIHIHLSETLDEVAQVEEQTGMKPVAYLDKLGVLDARVAAAHCVHLDDDELQCLIDHDVGIVHCPTSNMKLASGFARVPDMLNQGAIVGLGTDGTASNNRLDMLQEARMAALIHKGHSGDPRVVNAEQALTMATIGSARALGLDHIIGSLEPGKKADFTLISMEEAHNQPLHNLCSQLIYAAEADDVVLTAVDGVVLYEYGDYPHLDEERIIARCNEAAHRLARQAEA